MPRVQITKPLPAAVPAPDDDYGIPRFPSGSTMLDLVVSGGWAEGRVVNIVGDRSAGKTLLAIEACANFAALHGTDNIRYAEVEAAFDVGYARTMGLPEGVIPTETGEIDTVEKFARDFDAFLKERDGKQPCLYILDSLDALTTEAEIEKDYGEGSYGTAKAKMMSEVFRKSNALAASKRCTLIIISQIRDKIGVTFGETKTRSGGRALDFFASQIVWLSEIKKLQRTVSGVSRVVGVQVLAKNRKNKTGRPFREAEFTILFNYGVDDETSMIDWLTKNKGEERLKAHAGMPAQSVKTQVGRLRDAQDREALAALHAQIKAAATEHWEYIESELTPPMSKY